jgi:hypothetical protein
MGKIRWLLWIIAAGALAGCGSSLHDSTGPGPIAPDLYQDAQLDNQQRLAGEDHRVTPLYKTPLEFVSVTYDQLIGDPIARAWDYITHDDPSYAARKMVDPVSPDNRRAGTLRLVSFSFARKNFYLRVYANEARDDEDYTVRAAGLRALNRCRARGYSLLFINALSDDQPLVRLEAADCLSNMPDPQAVSALIYRLQGVDQYGQLVEGNVDVRIACADALRCYHTAESMRALVNELADKDFGIAWQSRQSLELITGQDYRYDTKAWLNYLFERDRTG